MMGMHGEAWVNHAIQEADLLIALGMRFDDRVTGNLKTYAPKAKKIHIEIDPAEINKNVKVDVALVGDLREVLQRIAAARRVASIAASGSSHIDRAEGRFRRARHPEPARQRPSLRRARDQRSVARNRSGNTIVVTDVGQHQMWEAQYLQARTAALADYFRRPGHDGICAARGDRRQSGAPGGGSVGDRRRRRLPDDHVASWPPSCRKS